MIRCSCTTVTVTTLTMSRSQFTESYAGGSFCLGLPRSKPVVTYKLRECRRGVIDQGLHDNGTSVRSVVTPETEDANSRHHQQLPYDVLVNCHNFIDRSRMHSYEQMVNKVCYATNYILMLSMTAS